MKLKRFTGDEVRELRRKCGMNQSEFWARFMTTQSGGSRYESGRDIPGPVQVLLNIAFGAEGRVACCAVGDQVGSHEHEARLRTVISGSQP